MTCTAPILRSWLRAGLSRVASGPTVVFVDDAAEEAMLAYRSVYRGYRPGLVVWWVLVEALMWSVNGECRASLRMHARSTRDDVAVTGFADLRRLLALHLEQRPDPRVVAAVRFQV